MIGQNFAAPAHLRPRPFASGYNAAATGASNLGPASAPLIAAVAQRQGAYTAENGSPGPIDAVTTSGSGLDSHISLQNAAAQAPRAAGWLARITRENVGSDPLRKGVAFEITVTSEQDLQGPRNRITPPHFPNAFRFAGLFGGLGCCFGCDGDLRHGRVHIPGDQPVADLYDIGSCCCSAIWSGPGIAASAMGFLACNFIFTEALYTFQVTR